jgi:hypothetical protein
MTRKLTGFTLGIFLFAALPAMTGCMTTQGDSKRQERTVKKSKKDGPINYGLVTSKSKIDRGHLMRGQRAMYSNALDSY